MVKFGQTGQTVVLHFRPNLKKYILTLVEKLYVKPTNKLDCWRKTIFFLQWQNKQPFLKHY